jgi:hypothetical protein
LRVCYFVAPSLTRGGFCNLLYNYFWTLPEQSLLGRSPVKLTAIFYCFIWDSPNLEGQVPVFISPRNRVAQLYPRALGSFFVAFYDSQGCGGSILTRLHTGYYGFSRFSLISKVKFRIKNYPRNRPWRPIRLWDVDDPTLSRQSARRWQWGCQPYATAALCLPEFFSVSGTHLC